MMALVVLLLACGESASTRARHALEADGWQVASVDDPLLFEPVRRARPDFGGATCFRAAKNGHSVEVCALQGLGADGITAATDVGLRTWRAQEWISYGYEDIVFGGDCPDAVADAYCVGMAGVLPSPVDASCAPERRYREILTEVLSPPPACSVGPGVWGTSPDGTWAWMPDAGP